MIEGTVESTAVVRIYPQGDRVVTLLYNEGVRLRQYAEARLIKTDEDIKAATNDLALISKLKKAIEEKRQEYVGPINAHLKSVNKAFTDFTTPLTEADTITRQKVKDHRAEQERIRLEQEKINQLRLEAAQKEMDLKGEITESVNLVEVSPEVPRRVATEMGTISSFKVKKWEVVSFELVPDQYKMLNEVLIGKMVRAGIPGGIPGIRIWEEDSLRVTTK